MSHLPVFSAAIFDLDGTLIDSYEAIHDSLGAVLKAFGREPVTLQQTRAMVGHGLESLIEGVVGRENVADGVRIFRERYAVVGPRLTGLLPGADEVTLELERRGIPLAIASNKPSYFSRPLVDGLGIGRRIPLIVGPDSGFPPKPAPDMVLALLEEMESTPAETLFIGDMPVDIETARAAGMAVAVLPTGSSEREELESLEPDYLFDRLVEVLDLFPSKAR